MASQKLLAVGKLRNDREPLVHEGERKATPDLSLHSCPEKTDDGGRHKPRNAAVRCAQRVPERPVLCISAAALGVGRIA